MAAPVRKDTDTDLQGLFRKYLLDILRPLHEAEATTVEIIVKARKTDAEVALRDLAVERNELVEADLVLRLLSVEDDVVDPQLAVLARDVGLTGNE